MAAMLALDAGAHRRRPRRHALQHQHAAALSRRSRRRQGRGHVRGRRASWSPRLGLVELTTRAPDKRIFLERPDAGRALCDEGKQRLAEKCAKGPQLQVCYGDGLSAAAINAHLEAFHGALMPRARRRAASASARRVFVRRSRVKVMDEIARLVDAEACVFTCGERPGLGFADSMSSYYIYRPASGATDADREVISNINPRGLEPVKAAHAVAEACARILAAKKSGVVL